MTRTIEADAAADVVIVEIKRYTPGTGMNVVEYLEIEETAGDQIVADYEVRHYRREGMNRTRLATHEYRKHVRNQGDAQLVRHVLNQILGSGPSRKVAA